MQVYVAGKFEDKAYIQELYERVRAAGHEVVYDWTTHVKSRPYEAHAEQMQTYCRNEVQAILDADVFIYLTHERGTTLHMEYGVALGKAASGRQIQIFVVGEHNTRSPWYFNEYVQRVATVEDVFTKL